MFLNSSLTMPAAQATVEAVAPDISIFLHNSSKLELGGFATQQRNGETCSQVRHLAAYKHISDIQ